MIVKLVLCNAVTEHYLIIRRCFCWILSFHLSLDWQLITTSYLSHKINYNNISIPINLLNSIQMARFCQNHNNFLDCHIQSIKYPFKHPLESKTFFFSNFAIKIHELANLKPLNMKIRKNHKKSRNFYREIQKMFYFTTLSTAREYQGGYKKRG